ncbi:MAG: hydroxyneurosporene methyltransferase [Acidobacteria bacterium]|nr:hydroxyneurosporene methyltransferase [Acidobacteriota bacterium]
MGVTSSNSLEIVNELIFGRWKSRILYAGVALGLFDALQASGKSFAELASELKLDARMVYRLLRALASIGLLEERPKDKPTDKKDKDETEFFLNAEGLLLCKGHPANLRDVALLQDSPEHTAIWNYLPEMVREGWQNAFRREFGGTAFAYADGNPAYSRVFDAAMASYSAQQTTAAVAALGDFDFTSIQSICDIGGGRGTLLRGLLREKLRVQPHLRGTVLERPAVIAQAGPSNPTEPREPGDVDLNQRCTFIAGDMFAGVPPADLYLLKLILHDWDDAQCVQILGNVRRAALEYGRTSARLLIFEYVIPGPEVAHFSKLYDIHMMCWGDGQERSVKQYGELLGQAGWKLQGFRALPAVEMGIVEARLAVD